MKKLLVFATMLLILSGCSTDVRRERDEWQRLAETATERLKQANDRTEQAVALAERAIKAGEYWKAEAEKCNGTKSAAKE